MITSDTVFKSVKIPDDNQTEMKQVGAISVGHGIVQLVWRSIPQKSHFLIIDGHAFYDIEEKNPFTGDV